MWKSENIFPYSQSRFYDIDYRRNVSLCMNLKRHNDKENDKRKKCKIMRKNPLWDVAVYFKLSFLKNISQ